MSEPSPPYVERGTLEKLDPRMPGTPPGVVRDVPETAGMKLTVMAYDEENLREERIDDLSELKTA